MNSLPTHYHCWLMTPSFLNPKRNPMIPLEQKLLDLNLTVMSHHLETTLSEAAGKNLSAAATLEWLADMELEARRGRAIERRFKCSKVGIPLTQPDVASEVVSCGRPPPWGAPCRRLRQRDGGGRAVQGDRPTKPESAATAE